MTRTVLFFASLGWALCCLLMLLSGAVDIRVSLPLPYAPAVGNLLLWMSMISFSAAACVLLQRSALWLSVLALLSSFSWLPLSVYLAGNGNLRFSGASARHFETWLGFSAIVFLFALSCSVWSLFSFMLKRTLDE